MSQRSDTDRQSLFTEYYSKFYNEFYRYAFYFMGNADDAEDAVSEAVTLAFSKFESLRERDKFKYWFLRILQNVCKTALKKRSGAPLPLYNSDDTAIDVPDTGLAEMDVSAALRQLLDRLKPDDKSIVLMSVLSGYSSEEIAQALGMTAVNVRVRLFRALGSMRDALTH